MILWAIKSPDGEIDHLSVRRKRAQAIASRTEGLMYWTWREYYNIGYRAVKVELKEVL